MTLQYIMQHAIDRSDERNIRRAECEIENLKWAPAYAEPGYSDPAKCILFANWNPFSNKLTSVLEQYGYSIEWSDEWSTCEECGKAVRTSANSYGWRPSFVIVHECTILCKQCFLADDDAVESYIKERINSATNALNIDGIDPARFGFVKVNGDFESGWHPGQNANPQEILNRFNPDHTREMLFSVNSVGQFDMQFSIWERLPAND